MRKTWKERFAANVREFEGYPIGKTIQYLTDPEIISLAGGLPSPDVFQRSEVRLASQKVLERSIDRIMQYSPIPGEGSLYRAVLAFLARDDIHLTKENLLITTSGQHGLDLTGRLFLEEGDVRMATSNQPEDRLGALLFRFGMVTQQQLESALSEQHGKRRLGRVLIDNIRLEK